MGPTAFDISIPDDQAEKITTEWISQSKELAILREQVLLLKMEKILSNNKNVLWIKSDQTDQRALSPILATFVKEYADTLRAQPRTIFLTTAKVTDILALTTDVSMDLESELQKYCEIVKSTKSKTKKGKNQDKNDEIGFYQGFKVKSDTIASIKFDYTF